MDYHKLTRLRWVLLRIIRQHPVLNRIYVNRLKLEPVFLLLFILVCIYLLKP